MTILGCLIVWSAYHKSMDWLYYFAALKDANGKEAILELGKMYDTTMWIIGGIVLSYVGANAALGFKKPTN